MAVEQPAHAFEDVAVGFGGFPRLVARLLFSDLVDGLVEGFDDMDMEAVEHQGGMRPVCFDGPRCRLGSCRSTRFVFRLSDGRSASH